MALSDLPLSIFTGMPDTEAQCRAIVFEAAFWDKRLNPVHAYGSHLDKICSFPFLAGTTDAGKTQTTMTALWKLLCYSSALMCVAAQQDSFDKKSSQQQAAHTLPLYHGRAGMGKACLPVS